MRIIRRGKVEGFQKNYEILTASKNEGRGSYQIFRSYPNILNGSYPEIFSSPNYNMMMLIAL